VSEATVEKNTKGVPVEYVPDIRIGRDKMLLVQTTPLPFTVVEPAVTLTVPVE
jgi:hypothetical protein